MCLTVISLFFARICDVTLRTNEMIVLLLLVLILSLGAAIASGTLMLGLVNSVGNVVVALLVARKEGSLELDTYRRK